MKKILLLLIFLLLVCGHNHYIKPVIAAPPGNPADWELTFEDNFDGTTLDWSKWNTRYQFGDQTINHEFQAFTDAALNINNGTLSITADNANPPVFFDSEMKNFTAGAVTSAEKFYQQYGYFEIRAKLPSCMGCWPGFWMLAQTENGANEIDILEQWSDNPHKFYMATFQGPNTDYSGVENYQYTGDINDLSQYHTFGVDWQPTRVRWYLDGVKQVNEVTSGIPQPPMYVIASYQLGGPGRMEPDPNDLPQNFDIDYIKVYRNKNGTTNDPQIWPIGRTFVQPTQITLSDSTSNSEIYYTTDGSDPTQNSNLYTGPITLNTTTNLKVRAFTSGLSPSSIITANFNIFSNPTNLNGWGQMNIFDPRRTQPIPGFAKTDGNGKFIIGGAGYGLSGQTDVYYFVYRKLPNDGEITARVANIDYFAPKTKVGLMVRSALTTEAVHVSMVITPILGSKSFYRSVGDLNTYQLMPDPWSGTGNNGDTYPIYLRLVRKGDNVSAWKKKNINDPWISMSNQKIGTTGEAYIGFTVSSRYFDMYNTAIFDNVTLVGDLPVPASSSEPSPSASATPNPACKADLNTDTAVNGADMILLIGKWLVTGTGDINLDGKVNAWDATYIFKYFGGSCQ